MRTHRNTVVIGAGQAGLAASWWLVNRGVDHVVLERGRVAEKWRTQRWDSFTLLSPNWQTRLPGHVYAGPDPEGFMTGAETAAFLTGYARSFAAPVVGGVSVTGVRPGGPADVHGWALTTSAGPLTAGNVIVATGELGVPYVPPLPMPVPAVHTGAYRNPDGLPPGAVLVVGAGPSGQQIARELAAAGRPVHLAVGRHKALPRRYRGRDAYWWMDRLGMLSRSVDTLPGGRPPRRGPNAVLAGGTRDLDVPALAAEGVVVHGRLLDVRDGTAVFGDGLAATLATAEANAERFRAAIDAYVAATGYPARRRGAARARPGRRGAAHARPRRDRRRRLGHRVPPRLLVAGGTGAGRRRRARPRARHHHRAGDLFPGAAVAVAALVELPRRRGGRRRARDGAPRGPDRAGRRGLTCER